MSASSAHEARLEDAATWLEIADEDLRVARLCLALEPVAPRPAAYHCQQCAEKLLKALLILASVPFPRTHDLGVLAALLPDERARSAALATLAAVDMSPWAVAGRYPEMRDEPGVPASAEVAAAADRLVELRHLVARALEDGQTGCATPPA